MSRAEPINTAASVKQRLLNLAHKKGEVFLTVYQPAAC